MRQILIMNKDIKMNVQILIMNKDIKMNECTDTYNE